jgi:cyclase
LLVSGRNLVKGERFQSWRVVGSAMQAARIHQGREVDELVILDVAATSEGRSPDLGMVEELATECRMPLAVGGGVRTVEDVRQLLRHGADKVVIGTAAIEQPDFVREVSDTFGSQAVVVSLDVREHEAGYVVYTRSGAHIPIGLRPSTEPAAWARYFEKDGAGEILLQSIDRDGTMRGYDLDLIREVSRAVSIPVIASGGCSGYEDMLAAFKAGADACAAGALYQFADATPKGAAQFLKKAGLEVRV